MNARFAERYERAQKAMSDGRIKCEEGKALEEVIKGLAELETRIIPEKGK